MAEFPTDEVGERIKKDVTFFDVMGALLTGKCVYETMMGNYGDSIVRERVFDKMAKLHNVDYDVIEVSSKKTTDALASWMNCLWFSTLSFDVSLYRFSTSITNRASEVTICPKHPLFPKYGF